MLTRIKDLDLDLDAIVGRIDRDRRGCAMVVEIDRSRVG